MNKSFGKALKILRSHNNMTQVVLAKHLNRSLPTIKKYESGEILMPVEVLDDICCLFGVTLDAMWFLGKMNTTSFLEPIIIDAFSEINSQVTFSNNDYLLVSSKASSSGQVTIVTGQMDLYDAINKYYCQNLPISTMLYKRIVYLAVCSYWQEFIYPQIKKSITCDSSLLVFFEREHESIGTKVSREKEALEIFMDIINAYNNTKEMEHIITLMEQVNTGLDKLE